jgi:hypothetical protein
MTVDQIYHEKLYLSNTFFSIVLIWSDQNLNRKLPTSSNTSFFAMIVLHLRTAKNRPFAFEICSSATIGDLKTRLSEEHPELITPIRLVLKGVVLRDPQVISTLSIQPADVILIFQRPSQTPKTDVPVAPLPEVLSPTKQIQPTVAPPTQVPAVVAPAQPGLFTASDPKYVAGMEALQGLGFSRERSDLVLRATRCNVEQAANTLYDGGSQRMQAFMQVRELIRANPNEIEKIIQNFEQIEPNELGRQYRQHPEELIEWLGIDPSPFNFEEIRNRSPFRVSEVMEQLTEDDRRAIERIVALGFTEPKVITCYLAAGRNEVAAVNLLLGG